MAYIDFLLRKMNIVYGIQREIIEAALETCNRERKIVRGILIARGDEPVKEEGEYFEKTPLLKEVRQELDEKIRVDYKTWSPFLIVKKDQALAEKIPKKPGQVGKDVHGAILPYGIFNPAGVTGGKNTRTEERYILSEINGQLIEQDRVLSVQDNLVIKGPVGYRTGHILFPGDVRIEGPVNDGFQIHTGGSVVIKQTFDVTHAVIRGNLEVAGGIIGRRKAMIKTGGYLKTKFIDNCRVASRKTITVDREIVNSQVFTLDRLEMSEKGRILGGDIYAVHGMRAGYIGNKLGNTTRIHLGVDFTAQQEKEKNNNLLRLIAVKQKQLMAVLADPALSEKKRRKIGELLSRLEKDYQEASARVVALLGRIDVDRDAVLTVTGSITEGTLVEICHVGLFVSEMLRKVRIRLNREEGKLLTESL